jgi:hypothetical protein
MGTDLLQIFVSHHVQLLHQQRMAMWMYPGPSCHNRSFSVKLGDTEINTRIQGVLAHGTDLNFGSNPVPLTEGVKSPWVSPLELILVYLCQFLLLRTHTFFFAQDLGYAHSTPRWVTLPEDVARQEANCVHNEWLRAWRQRRWAWNATRAVAMERGEVSHPGSEKQDRSIRTCA